MIIFDFFAVTDWRQVTLLPVCSVSMAFDTFNNCILVDSLEKSFGIVRCLLQWLCLSVSDRSHLMVLCFQRLGEFDDDKL